MIGRPDATIFWVINNVMAANCRLHFIGTLPPLGGGISFTDGVGHLRQRPERVHADNIRIYRMPAATRGFACGMKRSLGCARDFWVLKLPENPVAGGFNIRPSGTEPFVAVGKPEPKTVEELDYQA